MAGLDTDLHLRMLERGRERRSPRNRLRGVARALRGEGIYGMEWGDPDAAPPLTHVRDRYLLPHVDESKTVLEIGPGGGRWTRYMTTAAAVYAVDCHEELLSELRHNVRSPNLRPIHNNGDDFPGVPDGGIDFVFSFGTFVHLDVDIIERYLANLRRVMARGASAVIQYSDKTAPMGRMNGSFSENEPETMRALVRANGYEILEEDTRTLWHSAVIRFGRRDG